MDAYRASSRVFPTRRFAGQAVVHVYSDEGPGGGFEPVDVDLRDVYFSTLHRAA